MSISLSPWIHNEEDVNWMRQALSLADQAVANHEVPMGAILVADGCAIGSGFNQPVCSKDPTAHAEMLAIRQAATGQSNYRLSSATLYVTLMPCMMCVGAILHARIGRVVCAAVESRYVPEANSLQRFVNSSKMAFGNLRIESGCMGEESKQKLRDFFSARRRNRHQLLASLSDWTSIPNVDKNLNQLLINNCIIPSDSIDDPTLDKLQSRLTELLNQGGTVEMLARIKALRHFLSGQESRSWAQFLEDPTQTDAFGEHGEGPGGSLI